MTWRNSEIAKLFDADGRRLGEYWPGAPGWTGVKINQIKKLKAMGLMSILNLLSCRTPLLSSA